jgi:hypothetical protein
MKLLAKWRSLQPNSRAVIIVVCFGAFGALLACWWDLSIGEKEFASGVKSLHWILRMLLGSFGAAATVFVVAKTDTSKLIHCAIIAALSGMAGPYLVIKALSTVMSVNPSLVQIGSAISIVESTTTTLNNAIQAPTAGTNPQKIVDAFDQTAQATSSYLTALKNAPENEKQRVLSDSKGQLQQTLKVLGAAAAIVPKQSVPLIKKLATEAKEANLPAVANEAQKILDTNSVVRTAAETAENIGKVYFITPDELTDDKLHDLHQKIRLRFPRADIQPALHPTRHMEAGLEIVYYRDLPFDRQIANDLGKVVTDFIQERKIETRGASIGKNFTDQAAPSFQFDIHIGPDIAAGLLKENTQNTVTPSPTESPMRRRR